MNTPGPKHSSRLFPHIPGRHIYFLIAAAAGFCAMVPATLKGIPVSYDFPNHLRLALPFYSALQAGHWHPGWTFEVNQGFGDPSLRFYPPGLYYLLAAARALFADWYSGILVIFVLLSILGSIGAYFWARAFLPDKFAVLAGVIYAFVPWRINEFYWVSLIAEYAATTALPFAFGFLFRVCKDGKPRDIAGLALSYAALVLTNLPMAVIGSLTLGFYGILTIEKGKYRQNLIHLGLAVSLGLAASSFYWVTMIAELPWIRNAELDPNSPAVAHYDYRNNFVFSPVNWGNPNTKNTMVVTTLCMLFAPVLMLFWRNWKMDRPVKILFALLGVSLFMMTDLSRPVWLVIPKLKEVQFPGRFFAVASLALSILVPASIPFCRQVLIGKLRPLALIGLGGVLIGLAYSSTRIRDANYLPSPLFASVTRNIFSRDNIDQWLPVWVNERPKLPPVLVEAQDREISINAWEPQSRSFSVGAGTAGEIRVKTLYYPHWTATSQGKLLTTRPSHDGVILLSVPSEPSVVALQFREPMRTRVAEVVTGLAWAVTIFLLLYSMWKVKRPDPVF